MKTNHCSLLLLLGVASFSEMSFAQEQTPPPRPLAEAAVKSEAPESRREGTPDKPRVERDDRGESRARPESERDQPRRGPSPEARINPERGRPESAPESRRDGDHDSESKREGERGPMMQREGDADHGSRGPRDGEKKQAGPRDGEGSTKGPHDGEQAHRGPGPKAGEMHQRGSSHEGRSQRGHRDGRHAKRGSRGGDRDQRGPQSLGHHGPPPQGREQHRGPPPPIVGHGDSQRFEGSNQHKPGPQRPQFGSRDGDFRREGRGGHFGHHPMPPRRDGAARDQGSLRQGPHPEDHMQYRQKGDRRPQGLMPQRRDERDNRGA